MTQELQHYFTGVGEMKGFCFTQLHKSENAYVYEVSDGVKTHYEVFERRQSPICLDFKTNTYSDKDFKERYPKSNNFSSWAWCVNNLKQAMNYVILIDYKKQDK